MWLEYNILFYPSKINVILFADSQVCTAFW